MSFCDMQALKHAMESAGKLPSGPPGTLEHNKSCLLEQWYTREMRDPSAKEAAQEFADRLVLFIHLFVYTLCFKVDCEGLKDLL